MDAIDLIKQEQDRARAKGYTEDHDRKHASGEIGRAGLCFAEVGIAELEGVSIDDPPAFWPWENPPELKGEDRIVLMIKGAAMLASEIDKQLRFEREYFSSLEGEN